MAIDPRININENQVIFRRDGGHNHDGITSSLIDYQRYSVFDFVPAAIAPAGSRRRQFQDQNELRLKTFIVSAVEERVLNPQGIRVQANAITAREIVAGTISANELSSNIILINNIIRSNNYVGDVSGWRISSNGNAEFNDVKIRGNMVAGTIAIGSGDNAFRVDSSGNVWLGNTSFANATFSVTNSGVLKSTSANITGRIEALSGSIGPLVISETDLTAEWLNSSISIYAGIAVGDSGAPSWAQGGIAIVENAVANVTTGSRSLLNSARLSFYQGPNYPLWGQLASVTFLESGRLRLSGDRRVDISTIGTSIVADFRSSSGQITSGWGKIEVDGDFFKISRTEGSSKTVSIFQNASNNEFINLGSPITGAGGAGWQALYWSTGFGTLGRETSSIRYKENINDLEEVGGIIDQLRPVSFVMKPLNETTPESEIMRLADIQYGFIAEEVAEIDNGHLSVFSVVDGDFIPENWRIRDIVTLLVKEVQSLRRRVSDLEPFNGNL